MKRASIVLCALALTLAVAGAASGEMHQMGQRGQTGQQGQMGGMGMMCPMMGGGMMQGGMPSDPKAMATLLQMRGEMMQKMGEIMQKYAKQLSEQK